MTTEPLDQPTARQWESVALVVRSQCHDRTWIGHVSDAGYDDTPAGPLAVVKRACREMIDLDVQVRWRKTGPDTWTLEWRELPRG